MFQITLLAAFGGLAVAGMLVFSLAVGGGATNTVGAIKIWGPLNAVAFTEALRKVADNDSRLSQVTYEQKDPTTYESELTNALANGLGPDLFLMRQDYVIKDAGKVLPFPFETLPAAQFQRDFIQATSPFVSESGIIGIPLFADPLVLYVNNDVLATAGYSQPPQFWEQFQSMSAQLTKIGVDDALIQSGAALGTTNNIENATDILALLMMQTGAKMTNVGKTGATFHLQTQEGSTKRNPGMEALRFYTDFARTPPTTAFSWSENEPNNLEAFSNGKLAFFFGYSYHLPLIKARTLGKLNFSITPMVQIGNSNPVNIANYWMPLVSKKSEHIDASWAFIEFITAPSRVNTFLSKVKKPTAIRELIDKERSNEDLFAFAGQALTAKNWYYGKDIAVAKRAFEMMVKTALTVESDKDRDQQLQKAVNDAAAVINQTYK